MQKKDYILLQYLLIPIFLLFWFCPGQSVAYNGGLFYTFQLPVPGFGNSHLNYHSPGLYSYNKTPGNQLFGWFFNSRISTIDPSQNVFGSIEGGVFVGQELKIKPIYIAANVLAGLGLSVSDLGSYPGHLMLLGEARAELGFYLVDWIQAGVFLGLQGNGNLLPGIPFLEYAFYTPVLGFTMIWQGEDQEVDSG